MKILLFTHIFPYPLNEGGRVAQFGILDYLCKDNEIVLVAEESYPGIWDDAKALQSILPSLRIKILPATKQIQPKGIGIAILNKINKLQWRLQKEFSKKSSQHSGISDNPFFIYPTRPRKPDVINQLSEIIETENPDLVQVDFIDNADIVNLIPAGINKVLIHHDLRYASVLQACKLQDETVTYSNYLSNYVQTIEAGFLNKFDAVVTFSNDDKKKLSASVTFPVIEAIPFPVSEKNMPTITDELFTVKKLVFIGPHYHYPNYDAVEWYANEMADTIFKKYNLPLVVIGNWSASARQAFAHIDGISFAGFVDDLKLALQDAIMIVPLRIGSGIRTKLLDAFVYGAPVVSTSIGCEGLGARADNELLIADSQQEFLEVIEQLMNENQLLQKLRLNGNRFVRENYSQQSVGEKRMELYNRLMNTTHA